MSTGVCSLSQTQASSRLFSKPEGFRTENALRKHFQLPGGSRCRFRVQSIRADYGGPRTPGEHLLERNRANLRMFLDTADERMWEQWLPTGAFYGVTTNPLLLERADVECTISTLTRLANEAFSLGAEELQLQAWGGTTDDYIRTGLELAYIDPRVVVKIPLTEAGLEAANMLVKRGIRVTMTGIYNAHQVLLAASIGAEYAAPYLGRINGQGRDGEAEIVEMKEIVDGLDSQLRILVASIKSTQQVTALAVEGVTDFALPPDVVADMFFNENTAEAANDFEKAASKMGAASGGEEDVDPPMNDREEEGIGEDVTLEKVAVDG